MAFTAVDPQACRFRVRGTTGAVFELRSNGRATKTANYYTVPSPSSPAPPPTKGSASKSPCSREIWAEDPPPLPTPLPT